MRGHQRLPGFRHLYSTRIEKDRSPKGAGRFADSDATSLAICDIRPLCKLGSVNLERTGLYNWSSQARRISCQKGILILQNGLLRPTS